MTSRRSRAFPAGRERGGRRDGHAVPHSRPRAGPVVLLLVGRDAGARPGPARGDGQPLADYLSARIWQPMGAEADASWHIDKGGYEAAYFASTPRCATTRGSACCLPTTARATAARSSPPAGCERRPHRRPDRSSRSTRARCSATGIRHGSCPARTDNSPCRGLRGQWVFVLSGVEARDGPYRGAGRRRPGPGGHGPLVRGREESGQVSGAAPPRREANALTR